MEAPTKLSDSIDTTQSSCDEQKEKRESSGMQQTATLVSTCKENFADLETFKQPNACLKMKHQVDKHRSLKSLNQIKSRLKILKQSYKNAKEAWDERCCKSSTCCKCGNVGCRDEIKTPGKVDLLNLTLGKTELIS